MLNIYYGREDTDKEQFIFETIRKRGYGKDDPVVLIVPDQYTLEAEKSAFRHLKTRSLLGLDVYSVSRLGYKVLKETGAEGQVFINKYGRQMLLTRIARQAAEELFVFRHSTARSSFVEMTNDFISQLKQYGVGPEELRETAGAIPEDDILHRKLADLALIYERYQGSIEGKYTDSEDQVDIVAERIHESSFARARIWVYGFDSIAPRTMLVLQSLMACSPEVNVVLTSDHGSRDEDLFELPKILTGMLIGRADQAGCDVGDLEKIDPKDYPIEKKSAAIATVEREFFSPRPVQSEDHTGITLVEAANIHNEAESAAAFVLSLIRDRGYMLSDIALICNDQTARARALEMAFEEYGIPLFPDKKRGIESTGPAIFLISILRAVVTGYDTQDLMSGLKTGMTDLDPDMVEKLDIYARKYRIRWSMWKKPFQKGILEYGEEGMAALEDVRGQVMDMLEPLEELAKEDCSTRDFAEGFYRYITEDLRLADRLNVFIEDQVSMGESDLAQETEQIFGAIVDILDQIVEMWGDEPFDPEEFLEIFSVGLAQMEVGVLPSTADDLLMGTMQRTRSGRIKALLVMGANEGVLPQETKDAGLFGLDELQRLADEGHQIGKLDSIRVKEEKLAIYRNLSRPSEELWISYSSGDEEGREIRRSSVVEDMINLFPGIPVEKDLLNQDDPAKLIGGQASTMRHLSHAMKREGQGETVPGVWKTVERQFEKEFPEKMARLRECVDYTNVTEPLGGDLSEILFRGAEEHRLSPSRLERYGHCPFAYFVDYGLSPEEIRDFQVDSRDMGNAYHECIRHMAQRMDAEDSWMQVTEEQCFAMAEEAKDQITEGIREGIFISGAEEMYLSHRLVPTCAKSMWALVNHVRAGKVARRRHEVGFGIGKPIPPVEVKAGKDTFYIEGQIDRLDILENGRVKIIDYKSGNMDLKQQEARTGYRLQLMLYLKAAQEGEKKPAGVFYFNIKDPRLKDITEDPTKDRSQEIEKKMLGEYKLKGLMVADDETIEEIAGDTGGYSSVAVGVQKTKEGYKTGGRIISEEEFEQLQRDVDSKVEEFCRNLSEGRIDIHPMRDEKNTVCEYCDYSGICRFDRDYPGCSYNYIR